MSLKIFVGIAVALCLDGPAMATMYKIENPAEMIHNPAERMYNPATPGNNPAATIDNPATRVDKPNPASPPTITVKQQPATEVTATKPVTPIKGQPPYRPVISHKAYKFKTAGAYMNAAKIAFVNDEYREFIAISEDALRRIDSGTLVASEKTKLILNKYKTFGYSLLK